MVDRSWYRFYGKISLGNIGAVSGSIDQNMIPGRIFWRPAFCHLLVPFFAFTENRINIKDNTAIIKSVVTDNLSDKELRFAL